MSALKSEIASLAAQWVVEEGLDYRAAKQRAVKALGLPNRTALPDNEALETAVIDHIAVFCADSQAGELRALRELALTWMERMAGFRPYIAGAVWRGTATRLSDIYIQLFCDDSKSAEIFLIEQRVRYLPRRVTGFQGDAVDALSVHALCPGLNEEVGVHLLVYDHDDVRGALKLDARGRAPRGDLAALRALVHDRKA